MPGARRSVATAHRQTVATSTVLINDPFTGTNGAAPSAVYWGTPARSTGSTVDIDTNQLRMVGGTLGSYVDYQHLSSLSTAADFDFNIDVIIAVSTTEHFPQVGFRGSGVQETQVGEQTEQTTGYFVDFDVLGNLLILRRRTAGTNTILGSVTIDWLDGDIAHLRIVTLGSSIKVGCTRNAAPAPTTFLIDIADSTYLSGKFWLGHAGGADALADTVRFDNALVTIPPALPPGSVSGSLARALARTTAAAAGTYGTTSSFAQYKASVIAEMVGFAAYGGVTGGQAATSVTVVTTTADSGAGSLRAALTGGSDRWIVFDRTVFPKATETTINLTSAIQMYDNNNITLDGFGAQVNITGYGIITSTFVGPPAGATHVSNNFVVINIKISNITFGDAWDCLTIDGTDRMWLYHMDMSGGGDGNLDITNSFAGPNPWGYTTIQNCHIHDSKTGKGCLLGDQTEPYGDYVQASSTYPNGASGRLGGDNRITIAECRFKDTLRNPVISNYYVHLYNTYAHGYVLEGPALWGFNGQLRAENNVIDGSSAGSNAYKGLYAETYGAYSDPNKNYKRWGNSGNAFLGGATELDAAGGYLNPPIGSLFTIPYSYTAQTVTSDNGAALIARLASSSVATQGRAGVILRDGYADIVASGGSTTWSPTNVTSLAAPTSYDYTVGVTGSLQQIIDTQPLTNKVIGVPAGLQDQGSSILNNVNKDFAGCRIYLAAGAVLRGYQGFLLPGSTRNLRIDGPGAIEVNGGNPYGEGIYIDANRTDIGGDGNAAHNIVIDGVTVRPMAGTGPIQRNGINVWGCDLFQISNCTVHDAAGNAFGFYGAGSGISCGHAKRYAGGGSLRVLVARNLIYNMRQSSDGDSADRNGIILDIFHSQVGSVYGDYLIGDVVIDSNEIYDVDGRGIELLDSGLSDSQIRVTNNYVHGDFARHLGQFGGPEISNPVAGIGGYGAGVHGNLLVTNNIVATPPAGVNAYQFISFDGPVTPAGVTGSGNAGSPVVFEASPTNTVPSGF